MPSLVLVGYRRDALQTVLDLGWDALLIWPDPLPKAFAHLGHRQIDLAWDQADRISQEITHRWRSQPDAVVALTERSVLLAASIREALNLAGTRPDKALLGHDKAAMKQFFRQAGIAVTDWQVWKDTTDPETVVDQLGLPLVLKERRSSGSRGLVMAKSLEDVRRHGRPGLIAERLIVGREMSVESLVAPGRAIFVNQTGYLVPQWANLVPAEIPQETELTVDRFNMAILEALDWPVGMTHAEVFLTDAGPVLGEIAMRPPGGQIMKLISRAYDFNAWEAYFRVALGETPSLNQHANRFCGNWLLHPGTGEVESVSGLEEAARIPCIREVQCKLKPGTRVNPRLGTGQTRGYLLAEADTYNQVAEALNAAKNAIRIQLKPADGPGT